MSGLKRACTAGAALALMLAGSACTPSIKPDDPNALAHSQAVVLMAVKSAIPLSEARYCGVICMAWYPLDAHHDDVYAYPARVGSNFEVTQVMTADNRIGPLRGGELKIDRPGVYFYGTIVSSTTTVMMVRDPAPIVLLEAWRKFGPALSTLKPVNFAWPAADSAPDVFHYATSNKAQALLAQLLPVKISVGDIAPAAAPDTQCRMVGDLSRPDQLRYEDFVRRALNTEFKAAGWTDPAGAPWTGKLTVLTLATKPPAAWDLGIALDSAAGGHVEAKVHHEFAATLFGGVDACSNAEEAWRPAVQELVEALVGQPDFAKFAGTGPATPPAP